MFTGIIQKIGVVKFVENRGDAISMCVIAPDFFKDCQLGDSIANDGVCLTIESCTDSKAVFCLMHQTLSNTTFQNITAGTKLNLEKACALNTPMGGHFVTGHVDSVARVLRITPRETGVEVDLEIPSSLRRYVISKGSIALNGISLTVAQKEQEFIRVCIIPETLERTNLSDWKVGTLVNVEVDMLGKYMENYLTEFLKESLKGFNSDADFSKMSAQDMLSFVLQASKKE